jgi:predicted transcriptional regulator
MNQISIKQTALDVVKTLLETSSLEEVKYQINLAAQVLEGMEDIKEGRTSTTEELLENMKEWKKKK